MPGRMDGRAGASHQTHDADGVDGNELSQSISSDSGGLVE